ncbi:Protein DA1-related 1 [Raphanus sativus]|nr:Protein DA1-related 1 [Raphanus sativus]
MGKRLLVTMGWLTKILKGSSRKYSDGQANRRYNREDRSSLDTPRYSAEGSDFDKEEIECAIALSLSEQEHVIPQDDKGKKVIEYKSETEEEDEDEDEDDDEDEEDDEEYTRAQVEAAEEEEKKVAQAQIEEEEKRRAEAELEELEKQLAKARLEEEEVRRAKAQLEEDEQLAKALQESMNAAGSPPRYDSGSVFPSYPFSVPSRMCTGCRAEIGHGRFLSCMGGVWHPECFCCHACDKPIIDYEFSMSGNRPYHKLCYKEQHHPKCDVCHNFIPTNPAGLIEYRAHPFWMQKYCPSHERDGTPRCCSCERMEPRDTKYLILDDGRKLCLECLDSAIMDTHECQPLYLEIREFYEGLHMKVEQQIPMLLVERSALNEAMEGEKHGHHHLPETRGLCLSEEQTVTTVLRRPKIGAGYKLIDMITEPCRLVRRCEVTAILILYGLPRLLTGSILAHEMMHAWLRLNGYPNLRPEVEEGICQVLAHMWLESETYAGSTLIDIASSSSSSSSSSAAVAIASSKKGERSDFEKKLGEFFKHQIESDSSSAYGDGFRQGNQAVLTHGLKRTLDHIRLTGTFP